MAETGIQPRGANTARGLQYVKVARPGKIVSRHCVPGEVVKVEEPGLINGRRPVVSQTDGLTEDYAYKLIGLGIVKAHELQPGDRPISVRPVIPRQLIDDAESKIETGALAGPKAAERALGKPQRGAV
jgi:hypothetical protein